MSGHTGGTALPAREESQTVINKLHINKKLKIESFNLCSKDMEYGLELVLKWIRKEKIKTSSAKILYLLTLVSK